MTNAATERPIVETRFGPVRGVASDGMQKFLGIRYATPPVGKLRWMPPIDPEPWTDQFDASKFGDRCAQPASGIGFSIQSNSEDCLFLNVFAPVADTKLKRPVMVWFPGGGWVWGAGDDYDPDYLVKDGGVVFVTLNYRVGLFGFFSHPSINAEGHPAGNYGYMDQQLALNWVRDNIAGFGGDPDNVTIAGESAGGGSVWAHLVSPASKGLFHRAIIQSSLPSNNATLADNESLGKAFAEAAGCANQSSECLRALTPDQIVAINDFEIGKLEGVLAREETVGRFSMGPMVDGGSMPKGILESLAVGEFARVPVIIGITRDEMTLFIAGLEAIRRKFIAPEDYPTCLKNNFGGAWSEVAELYPLDSFDAPGQALATVLTDAHFVQGVLFGTKLIQRYVSDAYLYEFNVRNGPMPYPPHIYPLRAYHTAELPFVFKLWHGATGAQQALSEDQEQLSRDMVQYWCNFAATGNPNAQGSQTLPAWEKHDPAVQNYLSLEVPRPRMAENFGEQHHEDFWSNNATHIRPMGA